MSLSSDSLSPFPSFFRHHQHTRRFHISWTNSRQRTRSTSKYDRQEAEGTQYSNGLVTLDTGSIFQTLSDMEDYFAAIGTYEMTWQDE